MSDRSLHVVPDPKGAPAAPFGVLLVNLGTPSAPTAAAVRRYLREFLSDRRVVDAPRWLWWLVLNGVILNIRPPRVAKLYQSIWTPKGSPLLAISEALRDRFSEQLRAKTGSDIPVALAMTYGEPSLKNGLLALRRAGVSRVLTLPLYPQYSCSTTAAVIDGIQRALQPCRALPEHRWVHNYHTHPAYIEALASSVRQFEAQQGRAEKLVLSFHGVPQRYADQGDPYARQCAATSAALRQVLQRSEQDMPQTFQSRFGREPWLEPYTDLSLQDWAKQGVRSVDILCPGFAVDCLETLEEIAVGNRELFEHAGGARLRYIPALNDSEQHAAALVQVALAEVQGWM